jgi:gamma-glutamyltranspeptidase/glutathione hydrolase
VHDRLGRLDLHDVVAPAVRLAEEGFEVGPFLDQLIALLGDILGRTDEGQDLFFPGGERVHLGDRFRNPRLAALLADIGAGRVTSLEAGGLGAVGPADLAGYEVIEREPLHVRYRDALVLTNPLPSLGGTLVAHGLGVLEESEPRPKHDPLQVVALAEALVSLTARRAELGAASTQGTTHVAVVDAEGNVASMTTSNGSGSGEFAPGTGVQLNNVMGEEDLQPAGLGTAVPGERIPSMMSPTIVLGGAGHIAALGSGGSERIRSTVTQLVVDLVDHRMTLADAVAGPRLHWDDRCLQVEPGLPDAVIDALSARWEVNVWERPDLYFGGANGVVMPDEAVGDARRGGRGILV